MISASSQLVVPGTRVIFVPEGSTSGFSGTAIEVDRASIRAVFDSDEQRVVSRRTHGSIVVIAGDGRSTVVAVDVAPSRNLYEITPTTDDPPERRAHPRVPVSNLVRVTVTGRISQFEGRMIDLSLGGCQIVRHRNDDALLSKRSTIEIETALGGQRVRYVGQVVKSASVDGENVFSVQFAGMDVAVHTFTERFIDQRLARVAAMSAVVRPVVAKVQMKDRQLNALFDPLDNSFSAELTTSARIVARFRLPSVPPTLVAGGMVTSTRDGRSFVRWNRTDPVTQVLIGRAAADRRAAEAASAAAVVAEAEPPDVVTAARAMT